MVLKEEGIEMNIRKGFFRLTLVVSFLCGILGILTVLNISDVNRGNELRTTHIPLPRDWKNKTLQEKLDMIDKLDTELRDWMKKGFQEDKEAGEKAIKEKKPLWVPAWERAVPHWETNYYELSPREKREVKEQLRGQITSDEKKMPWDRESYSYFVHLRPVSPDSPNWIKRSFSILTGFTIGFAPVWLIYAFIRWVVIGFIVGGFGGKSLKGGEPDQPKTANGQKKEVS